jgi:lysozyme
VGAYDEALALSRELAEPFEGRRLKAYHDPVGFPTQGCGRLLSRVKWEDLSKYPDIDDATCDAWLSEDLEKKGLSPVIKLTTVALSPEQLAALIDFCFNCGGGNYQASTLRKRVNDEDWEGAAEQFGRWVYAGAVRLPGLVRRRAAERDLFLSGAS